MVNNQCLLSLHCMSLVGKKSLFVVIGIHCRRRLSVMNNGLANRTGQHKHFSESNELFDSSDIYSQLSLATSGVTEVNPEVLTNNPMYVDNSTPGNPHKSINITRQNIPRWIPQRETGHFYDEPPDTRQNNTPISFPQRATVNVNQEPSDFNESSRETLRETLVILNTFNN